MMARRLSSLDEIVPGRVDWKVKVRIIHLWRVPSYSNPDVTYSIEMILLDEKV